MTDDFLIRKFDTADAEAVIALWQVVLPGSRPWHDPRAAILRKLHVNDSLFFVGELDGRVLATVIAGYDGVRGWIYSLAVAEDQRRRGYGARMLAEAERALRARGCAKVNLQVLPTNSQVVEFYQRCGFTLEDRLNLGKALQSEPTRVADPVPDIVVSDEITLTQISGDDRPHYLKHLNETDVFHRHMNAMPYPYREIDVDQWLSKVCSETLEAHHSRNWAIRNREDELIGGAGVFQLTLGERAEIGYWLAKPWWGQGITTRVVSRLCDFAFEQYELHRICARAFAINLASARVLEKAGFQREGVLRSHFFRDGVPLDVVCFGRLRES